MQISIDVQQLRRCGAGSNTNHPTVAITVDEVSGDTTHLDLGKERSLSNKSERCAESGLYLLERTILSIELSPTIMASQHHILIGVIKDKSPLSSA